MKTMLIKIVLVWTLAVHSTGLWFAGSVHAQDSLSRGLAAQMAEEVKESPTGAENFQARFMLLTNLAHMLLGESRQERVDLFLPREKHGKIEQLIKAQEFGEAGKLIDESFARLSGMEKTSFLERIQRVVFSGDDGITLTGYLFTPENPGREAFVFGHGGFGHKEMWMDLMHEVSRQAGVYSLALDFQGCGESGGATSWEGRSRNFSRAMDHLQESLNVTRFAVGGHSGGGAYPAVCSAIEDERVSVVVLWDCPFDFYDMHLKEGASDPGGNPAALVEKMHNQWRQNDLALQPQIRDLSTQEDLNSLYGDMESTLKKYRHGARMLGEVQKKRQLAVLHIIAQDMIQAIGPAHDGKTFFLPPSAWADSRRASFLNRPLPFYSTELFNRPENVWKRWDEELGNPGSTVVIENTTHAFHPPGRHEAVAETVQWLQKHLAAQ